MKTITASPGIVLSLGREGENAVRQVIFDITDWNSEFGKGGSVALLAQRPGDTEPYPVAVTVSGATVTWLVSAADTAKPGVYGQAELQYRIGDVVVKSAIWRTFIADSLGTASPTPPEPQQAWVDQVLDAAQNVETAVVNSPKIQNGTWWVWEFESGSYVNTGVKAQGPAGTSPVSTHLNLKEEYNIDIVSAVIQAIFQGKNEVTIKFPEGESVLQIIQEAKGQVWLDMSLSALGVSGNYAAQITGTTIENDGSVSWADTKLSIHGSDGWFAGYVGMDSSEIFAKITDAPYLN